MGHIGPIRFQNLRLPAVGILSDRPTGIPNPLSKCTHINAYPGKKNANIDNEKDY
ncbi:MAG: hypothetical protein WAX07_10410 [Candidatus Altiarchaeia archaeon]